MPTETLKGYVVDIACLRKCPREELMQRAANHSRECALMGHCIESGYGIVDDEGRITPLDSHATIAVLDAVRSSSRDRGIQLIAQRESEGGEMVTRAVSVADG